MAKVSEMIESVVEDPVMIKPSPSTTEWTDYVVSLLADNELYKGLPTANGLRRVCELVYGEIIESKTNVLAHQASGVRLYACVEHVLVVRDNITNTNKTISACVDGYSDHLPRPFNMHLIATLDSKAEAKALRRLLKLTIVSSEEADVVSTTENSQLDYNKTEEIKDMMNESQKMALNTLCKRLNINVEKLLKSIDSEHPINHSTAADAINKLSDLQKDVSLIPDELKGFMLSWREQLGVLS